MDRFTWIVILIVILLVAGAVALVNVGGPEFLGPGEYLDEDSPTAAVHNIPCCPKSSPATPASSRGNSECQQIRQNQTAPQRR